MKKKIILNAVLLLSIFVTSLALQSCIGGERCPAIQENKYSKKKKRHFF